MENNPFNNSNPPTENFINRPSVALGLPTTPNVPFPNLRQGTQNNEDPFDLLKQIVASPSKDPRVAAIPLSSFSKDPRYSRGTRPGDNWEEAYAQNQTFIEKAGGILKGVNLVGTTVAGGFASVLYGLPSAAINGDITKIWDNPVNQGLQEWNQKVDNELLPSFYTQKERDAEWWSTDNWVAWNFLFDKLIKNSGYAVGAMVGGNIMNGLLLKAGNAIGRGATAAISTSAEASQAFKIFNPLLRNTARAFSRGKNIEAYEIAAAEISSIADASKRANQLSQLLNTTSKYANFGDTGRRTLTALYSSTGEASMEAIMGGNQMKDKLIQEYIAENGYEPTGEALDNINNTVKEFGKQSFFGNLALLGATEFVQLPYLAGSSWKNTRNAIRNTTDDVVRTGAKIEAAAVPTTRFGKLYQGFKKYAPYVFDPKEAGQEIGQYALEVGASNYFEKANQTDAAEGVIDSMLNFFKNVPGVAANVLDYGLFGRDESGKEVGALVSKEGIEGGILGGITGGLMQAPSRRATQIARKTNTQALIESSKNAPLLKDVIVDRINTVNRGVVLQEQQQAAALQNDILESKDLKTDLAFNYAMHKVKFGRTDLVLDEIQEMRQEVMGKENGFANLQEEGLGNVNDTKSQFLERLTELETFVKDLDSTYEKLNTVYGAETVKDAQTGKLMRRFSDAAIERMAYITTKTKDYDTRLPDLKLELASKNIMIDDALAEMIANPESDAIDKKLAEVDALDSSIYTEEDKKELKKTIMDVTELTLRKKLFIDEYNDIVKKPENYTENVSTKPSVVSTEEDPSPKETVKVKTKRGERDIEIGTEYFLGKVIDYTKQGTEVYRAPIIQVLGENENGTIKIKDVKTGDVFDVTPETIEDYSLGKVSEANPKGVFVINNWNKIYQHRGIKVKGSPALGRIEYDYRKDTLIFAYKNEKGVVKHVPVRNSQFVAQGDYKKGMITAVGTLTAKEEKSLMDLIAYKEEVSDSEVILRNQFLSKLYEDGMNRIKQLEESMSSKKEEVDKISKKLEELTLTKAGVPRKRITSTIRQQLDSLSKLRSSLEKQLEAEQNEKEELEYTVPFFKDMLDELLEYPEDNSAFIDKLKSDINLLEDYIDLTNKSIDDTKKLIDHIDELLRNALDIFNDYIKRLKEENPNIPLGIEQLQSNLERFLGEEGARLFIEERQGFTAKVLELEADINDFENDLKIPSLSKRAESLIEDLNELSEGIDKLIAEQLSKQSVLEKFQKFVDERKQMEKEEATLSTNKKFKEQAFKTQDNSTTQTKQTRSDYEPNKKKQYNILPNSTVGIDRGKPHQTRAKIFLANLPNYSDVYAVYINKNNESKLGLSGVIDLIRTDERGIIDESIDDDKILALVVVNGNGELLGVDGNPLTDEQLADAKNHAIFQVKPDPEFKWGKEFNGESMFRKGTPENIKKAIIEKYTKEKEALLKETEIGDLHPIAASWGIPEFEIDEEGKPNYDARNSVESTALIEKTTDKGNNSLEAEQVITVPTVNDIESQGLTSYSDALGKPFLLRKNAIVPLFNKKHTQEEAEAIYDAILELSRIAIEDKKGLKGPRATRVLNFLRGVVYWGIPKDVNNKQKSTGYNSIFFDTNPQTGKLSLTISNEGYDVVFSPTELERNKGEVIEKIKQLYNNVNSSLISKANKKFEQIISISPEGEIQSITWPNYQSYLLSEYMPDEDGKITTKGEKRDGSNIPLATRMRKVKNENDVNRHSIYFYTTDTVDDYAFEELKTAKKEVSRMTAGKLEESTAPTSKYQLDGETNNIFETKSKEIVRFRAPKNVSKENYLDVIKLDISKESLNKFLQKVKSVFPGISNEDALKKVVISLKTDILNSILGVTPAPSTEKAPSEDVGSLFNKIRKASEEREGKKVPTTEEEKEEKEAPSAEESKTELKNSLMDRISSAKSKRGKKDSEFREVIKGRIKGFQTEKWNEVEAFIKKALPNVPFYRLKNIIQATNGKQAWGMFQDAAIYVYENAEVGTAYHEVFEAVWKMFTDAKEKQNIIKEFKSRQGTFVDRPTGETIKYSEATPQQIKEQLAEEFRDYVQYKKVPVKPKDGRPYIVKLFYDLVNAIKALFLGPQAARNTEELFKRIGEGYYAKKVIYTDALSYAKQGIIDIESVEVNSDAEFREKLRDIEKSDVVDEMIYSTMVDLFSTNKSLFTEVDVNKSQLLPPLKVHILDLLLEDAVVAKELHESGEITDQEYEEFQNEYMSDIVEKVQQFENSWDDIVVSFEEKLMSYGVEFDENDNMQLKDDDMIKESDKYDATKIDNYRKANRAIKLLLATIPQKNADGTNKISSINGRKLLPVGRVYISLLNNASSSKSVDEMIENIRKMAEDDVNYRTLYKRITKQSYEDKGVNLSTLPTTHELQLITSLWKFAKKYNYSVKNVKVFDGGETAIIDAPLSTVADQLRSKYLNFIITNAKQGKGFFMYDEAEKAYVGNPLRVKSVNLGTNEGKVKFLNSLGISFNINELTNLEIEDNKSYRKLRDAVYGIKEGISKGAPITKFTKTSLNISGRLLDLAFIKAKLENPDVNSTHYNINGELTQSYMGPNSSSEFYEFLSTLNSFSPESFQNFPQYSYLLTDSFVEGSVIIDKIFTSDRSKRKQDDEAEMLFMVGYSGGIDNEEKGTSKPSGKLNYRERLIQELNLNIQGWYLNLVPGDSSLEHMIYLSNVTSDSELDKGMDEINKIFKGYFLSELKMSKEDRPIADVEGRKTTDLRFFKAILADNTQTSDAKINKLHNDIINEDKSPEEVYKRYEKKINAALNKFIEQDAMQFINVLSSYNILRAEQSKSGEYSYTFANIDIPGSLSRSEVMAKVKAITINYMVANIELHKLLYSDPYQYSDELKRIKSFNSPRQLIVGGKDSINDAFNNVWNEGYEKDDIGRTDFKSEAFRTVTFKDVNGVIDLPGYSDFKETDGSGIISYKAYRHFRIRAGEWNDAEERQYRYDVAWEKRDKSQGLTEKQIQKRGLKLSEEEKELLEEGNPQVQSAYVTQKPIVSGNKADGNPWNDVVLDKFALYPLSYRVMNEMNPDSNAVKLYNKMQKENIDYIVFDSGRKVGALNSHSPYINGKFNDAPFVEEGEGRNVINVPFEIISVQTEVPSKEKALVTRGSQVTKLMTLDFMKAGVPIDFEPKNQNGEPINNFNDVYSAWFMLTPEEKLQNSEIYKEIINNQKLLEAITEQGYNSLLKSLGIEKTKEGFRIIDKEKTAKTLRNEILKREVNDNISKALLDFFDKDVILESTPAYQQVRNILYSIADREFISTKITGGQKVQIPSVFLESIRGEETTINGKKGYTSEVLKFYEDDDGKRVCEIMVGRWFQSDMSDKDLLEYLNTTDEGKRILSGLAFRIPTQKQNSIDRFVIKQFLPKEFSDNVVVPAALVAKVGSDFDIDKLSIYFKNVFKNSKGEIKLVEYKGSKQETIDFYSEEFDKLNKSEQDYILRQLNKLQKEEDIDFEREQQLIEKQEKLNVTKEDWLENIYKKALENAYIESSEALVSNRKNYKALIQPNSAEQLKDLSKEIVNKTVGSQFDYKNVGNMLNRSFMSRLRHAFVTGKYAIGIAAVNQTNNSLNQRQAILIDTTKISDKDRYWLDNGVIKFKNHNTIKIGKRIFPTLSFVKNAERSEKFPDGQDISDITGQFIDGYVDISKGPWIMELGATPNVASTWLFLIKLGVPVDEVAYFMNQPIIRSYLRSVENAGYSYLFMEDFVDSMLIQYGGKPSESQEEILKKRREFSIPSKTALRNLVGKNRSEMSVQELEQQRMMLFEFLKYAKLGEHMFHVTQGTNFDTSNFNDPYLVFKKQMQLEKARETVIVSYDAETQSLVPAADAILKNSFLGDLAQHIYDFRNSVSETNILLSDNLKVRNVLQNVLKEYVNLNDRDFVKVAQKATNDFFDWIVQTKNGDESLNRYIKSLLIEDEGILPEIVEFLEEARKPGHPLYGNLVIDIIQTLPSTRSEVGGVNNIKIKSADNNVSDQNGIIYSFREIRDYLQSSGGKFTNLYDKIVLVSMLQSGLSNSPISFSSVLPYEDFQTVYNSLFSRITNIPQLDEFYKLGVFQKNNWNNDEIVPSEKAKYIPSLNVYNPAMEYLPENIKLQIARGNLPQVLTMSVNTRSSNFDHITYSYEVQVPVTEQDRKKMGITTKNPYEAQKQKKNYMRKKGDYSFIKKGLFKKVKNEKTGKYLIHSYVNKNGELKEFYVYKLVNAWGDSYRANEFYDYETSSIIENGMMKTKYIDDSIIIDAFVNKKKSLSQKLSSAETSNVFKTQPKKSDSTSTKYNVEEEYMYEPFTYSENNFDAYGESINALSLPTPTQAPVSGPIQTELPPVSEEDSWMEEDNNDTCAPF